MTRTIAWFHPFAGIAGDMTLGALLDAGADLDFVVDTLNDLDVDGWSVSSELVHRSSLQATRAIVDAPEQHHHRRWPTIQEILNRAAIPDRVRSRSLAVFEALAIAEAKVHGVSPDEVHFHEVGALDAIVDIVGSCAALESLKVDEIGSGPVAVGVGTIKAAHGILPNPPPAVVNLLDAIPTIGIDSPLELTTPTGAAIIKGLATSVGAMPSMTIHSSGYGAGSRDVPGRANVTQVIIGTVTDVASNHGATVEAVVELTTNVDDVTGEQLGYAISKLMGTGALDAWVTPIVMKKGRPAHTLSVLASPEGAARFAREIMVLTGSLGVRTRHIDRFVADRRTVTVTFEGHEIDVKVSAIGLKAEFDQVAIAAEALGLPPQEVANRAESLAADI